jgi:hypothetical protein
MEDLLGMLGVCSFFQPQHKPMQAPKRLIVPSCLRWKHMTILRMVIIDIIIAIIANFVLFLFRPNSDQSLSDNTVTSAIMVYVCIIAIIVQP